LPGVPSSNINIRNTNMGLGNNTGLHVQNIQGKKKIENLPRTGIEYPMLKDLGHNGFIPNIKDSE
jgi:hypothetical protein